MKFYLAHSVGRRMRWRTDNVMSAATGQEIAAAVGAIDGITSVKVNALTGSVLVTYAHEDAKTALIRYLAGLETKPVILKRKKAVKAATKKVTLREELLEETDVVENRTTAIVKGVSDLMKRAVAGMPVVDTVKRPFMSETALAAKDEAADLDFSPLARWLVLRPVLPMLINTANVFLGAIPYFFRGVKNLFKGKLNVEVLDASAIGVSLLLRDFKTAGLVILLLGMGEMLERYTRKKSLASLADQLALKVDRVWVRQGDAVIEKALKDITTEDVIVVRTGNTIPVDGKVVAGNAAVNQATMTGEPLPVHRESGGTVFAGTVVEDGEIDIQATKMGDGTRLNQIVKFIETSEKSKAGIQGKAEHLADAIVPFNFALAGLVFLCTRSLARTAAVLMVDYSCALRLATPLAILTAMKQGTKSGVLVKGGRYLEALAEVDTVVLDKTGTLTQASPQLSDVVSLDAERDEKEILALAACLEEHFPHPVSRAVVRAAEAQGVNHYNEEHDAEVKYVVAHGICSSVDGQKVIIGSRHFVEEDEKVDVTAGLPHVERLAAEGKSVLYMAQGGKLIGILGIVDPLRPEAKDVIRELKKRGIKRIVMLTGDDTRTAKNVAGQLGITEFRAQVLPTDKASHVLALKKEGCKVLMIGDGVNDSPALSSADVGATLKEGSDIAQEVADVVLTNNNLADLPMAIDLGRATMRRIKENFTVSVGLNTGFMAGGLFGVLTPALGAVLHNLTTIGVCLNAMRSPTGERTNPKGWLSQALGLLTAPAQTTNGDAAAEQLIAAEEEA